MEYSNEIPSSTSQAHTQLHETTKSVRTLKVDWSWRKSRSRVTDPEQGDEPLYIIKCSAFSFDMKFLAGPAAVHAAGLPDSDDDNFDGKTLTDTSISDGDTVGKGTIHPIKIDCMVEVNNQRIRVSAAKRLITKYNYQSTVFSSSPGQPDVMTWKTEANAKVYDMVLLDATESAIARFKCNYLGVKKLGAIELLTPRAAQDPMAMNEIVVTGLTLYATMLYRSSNPAPLVGALLARPGKDYKVTTDNIAVPNGQAQEVGMTSDGLELGSMDKANGAHVKEADIA